MKNNKTHIVILALALVLIFAVGGLIWLAETPLMPPIQTVEQVIQDDHPPR